MSGPHPAQFGKCLDPFCAFKHVEASECETSAEPRDLGIWVCAKGTGQGPFGARKNDSENSKVGGSSDPKLFDEQKFPSFIKDESQKHFVNRPKYVEVSH